MSSFTWSYSGLSTFKQCPHKFYRTRILKDVKEEEQEHLTYGKNVHKAAEEYSKNQTPIPREYGFIQPYVQKLLDAKGTKYFEYEMGLTAELEPCGFYDKSAWWRGIADYICVNEDEALLLDYKTGKSSRHGDTKQLEILSLAMFTHFSQVNKIKGALLFLVASDLIKQNFYRSEQEKYWESWDKDLDRLNVSFSSDIWNPKKNFTCYKFCPVLDCKHNGRGFENAFKSR